MNFAWSVSLIILALLIIFALIRSQRIRHASRGWDGGDSQSSSMLSAILSGSHKDPTRSANAIKRISLGGFLALLREHPDLLLFDLRPDATENPFSAAVIVVPAIESNLSQVLPSLSKDRMIVFFGCSSSVILKLTEYARKNRRGQWFVLDAHLPYVEAA